MFRLTSAALVLCLSVPVAVKAQGTSPAAPDKKAEAAKDGKKLPAKETPKKGTASLPPDVMNFSGKVTGTVESVDPAKYELKVKVTSATADPAKNKAPKPETLAGMSIIVTPLGKPKDDDTVEADAASVAYIKGAKPGDPVTLDVRASSKGVVFRLLKVPVSAVK